MITGSTGMVGQNISAHHKIKEHELLAPTRQELNLFDYENVEDYLNRNRPELIIHCAGTVGGIQANMREPFRFLLENIDMGRNIVLAACKVGINKLINLGSSCMYPRNAKNPLQEGMILKSELEPTNEGYALAKITIAKLCEYISKENPDKQYKTLIPCNLYGKWDKFDPEHSHMIPAVIRKIQTAKINKQKLVEIWGDGTARREFMYSEDLADFVLYASDRFDDLPPLMNVGLGYDYTINEYYKIIAEVIAYEGEFIHNLDKPFGMRQKLLDISQQKKLGWEPKTDLRSGIKKTWEFYVEHYT